MAPRNLLSVGIMVLVALCLGGLGSASAQNPVNKKSSSLKTTAATEDKEIDAAQLKLQQKTFAISLLMALADEARSYDDLQLRARVLARTADALWTADSDAARMQFRRAWEAAEKADAQEDQPVPANKNASPAMVIALKRAGGYDLRSEVLMLAARRDRSLGEEFIAKLSEDTTRASEQVEASEDSWSTSTAVAKRLLVARRLLDEGQIERAVEFAKPVLTDVNEKTISFLSALRAKRADLADDLFAALLDRVVTDPLADANTVSGLSSYAFTPGFYVTFASDGSVRWTPTEQEVPAPSLPANIQTRFFRVAASILLRPSLPPEEDRTSAGRSGRFLVIKRLLPLFEQHAPDTALALRTELTKLAGEEKNSVIDEESHLMTEGIQRQVTASETLETMQDRLDHASTSNERDAIYEDAAGALAAEGNYRAQDLTDKVERRERRERIRAFVDLTLIQFAIKKKDVPAITKLATSSALNHSQRAWAFTQAAHLMLKTDRMRAIELLEQALAETRRMDADDADRVRLLIRAAQEFLGANTIQAWEVASEAVKAANSAEEFSGEERGLTFPMVTRHGLKMLELDSSDFSLNLLFTSLAKNDLTRAAGLANGFQRKAPHAVATISIAKTLLE